jgi:2'-phosphotransferase
MEQIHYVVDTSDKKRYELTPISSGDQYKIRASQGHSLKTVASQDLLEPITQFSTPVIHGTHLQAWQQIKTQGLSRMNRNHVHFAIGLPNDPNVKSGMRKSSQVFIYINTEKAMQDGMVFYRSKNDVVLSDGIEGIIEPKYFEKVIDKQGTSLL